MHPMTGGYLLHQHPLIRGLETHTSALDRPVSQGDLDALNAVQATPWRINGWLLDVLLEAWERGLPVSGVTDTQRKEVLPRLPDAMWAAMPKAVKTERLREAKAIHAHNAAADSKIRAFFDYVGIAQDVRDYPEIYFPHSRCFRGRLHPMASHGPQPQGPDLGKALLMFATGLPLGPDGEYWLMVRAANCAGHDKLSLEERVAWTFSAMDAIDAAATDPLNNLWWCADGIDDPWQLLATCYELSAAWGTHPGPEAFVSHLPIAQDGTCNGLQHLSAMGLDTVGARATNLEDCGQRQDIYQQVADVLASRVAQDVAKGISAAVLWSGNITRKTCKRAVMTTPYGVTKRGMLEQFISDKLVPIDPSGAVTQHAAAAYLRDVLWTSMEETVGAARKIMNWLQDVAVVLAMAGRPFEWTTPSGSRVRQAYPHMSTVRVSTLSGSLHVERPASGGGLDRAKQSLGSAPNFVHSFDAAHLSMTVNAAHRVGIRSFSMIHDSYGTHACHTTEMGVLLRAEFAAIYREDWLAKTHADLVAAHPTLLILEPPPKGCFDIERVLAAPFFFS